MTYLRQLQLETIQAALAPTATDDSTKGYLPGHIWTDTVAQQNYICVDNTATAAVWHQIEHSSSDIWNRIGTTISPANSGDSTAMGTGYLQTNRLYGTSIDDNVLRVAIDEETDSFFLDAIIPENESGAVLYGVPSPSSGQAFTDNPCYVTVMSDTSEFDLSNNYIYTGGLNTPGAPVAYGVNDDMTLPFPPLTKYSTVWVGNSPDHQVDLTLEVAPIVPP